MENTRGKILTTFAAFTDGLRLIMLTHRGKEGGKISKPDRVAKKRLSRNPKEFTEIVADFLKLQESSDIPLRIYSCVNRRNPDKAIREFKRRQLDADYYDPESRYSFYTDITNRWISCVMDPASRDETKFLIDIDAEDDEEGIRKSLSSLNVRILLDYPTKNGRHIVTEPFNPSLLPTAEIKKDGLLLLSY